MVSDWSRLTIPHYFCFQEIITRSNSTQAGSVVGLGAQLRTTNRLFSTQFAIIILTNHIRWHSSYNQAFFGQAALQLIRCFTIYVGSLQPFYGMILQVCYGLRMGRTDLRTRVKETEMNIYLDFFTLKRAKNYNKTVTLPLVYIHRHVSCFLNIYLKPRLRYYIHQFMKAKEGPGKECPIGLRKEGVQRKNENIS